MDAMDTGRDNLSPFPRAVRPRGSHGTGFSVGGAKRQTSMRDIHTLPAPTLDAQWIGECRVEVALDRPEAYLDEPLVGAVRFAAGARTLAVREVEATTFGVVSDQSSLIEMHARAPLGADFVLQPGEGRRFPFVLAPVSSELIFGRIRPVARVTTPLDVFWVLGEPCAVTPGPAYEGLAALVAELAGARIAAWRSSDPAGWLEVHCVPLGRRDLYTSLTLELQGRGAADLGGEIRLVLRPRSWRDALHSLGGRGVLHRSFRTPRAGAHRRPAAIIRLLQELLDEAAGWPGRRLDLPIPAEPPGLDPAILPMPGRRTMDEEEKEGD